MAPILLMRKLTLIAKGCINFNGYVTKSYRQRIE